MEDLVYLHRELAIDGDDQEIDVDPIDRLPVALRGDGLADDGPEAVAFSVTTAAATAISDAMPWIYRLINSFGSPNTCSAAPYSTSSPRYMNATWSAIR